MRMLVCDTEVFKHGWLFCAKDGITDEEFVIWNDREAMVDFYNKFKNDLWIGYNIRGYDQFIIKAFILGMNPYQLSQWIIKDRKSGYLYAKKAFNSVPFKFYDVMTNRNMGSLKTLEGFLGMDIEETQVDFDLDRPLTQEEIDLTIKYCLADIDATCEVFNKTTNMFNAHKAIIKTFNRPSRDMCKTQAQLASKILGAKPKIFNDYYDIRMPDTLDINKYQQVVDWFLNSYDDTVNEMLEAGADPDDPEAFAKWFYSRSLEIEINGVIYVFGWGGLHAAILKYIHVCSDDEILLMADVNQLYPSIMVEYDVLSRAVLYPERFRNILNTSLELKAAGKKQEREPYKLINNISYGASGDKTNAMFDPLHRNLVCVFGQVLLLDLIEKLEDVCSIVQANTDGVLLLIKKKDLDTVKSIINEWETRTRLKMSYDEFERIYQGDVNNYLAVTKDGKIKSKGAYVKELKPLDYDLPIVNKAVKEYLVNGTHPRETILACDELMEFQKIYKISSKYSYAVWKDQKLRGKVFRVFASTNPEDTMLGKTKGEGLTVEKFALSPDHAFIWNKRVKDVKVPDYLDKEWYVDLAIKRLQLKFGIEVLE